MICRSPLSSLSGLILPEPPLCKTVQQVIGSKARELASEAGCSYLIFDYLSKQGSQNWPETFSTMTISDPGTVMRIDWPSFEAYLEAGNKKDRQHYKKTVREAEKLGIQVSRHSKVDDIEEALALVRGVERRHGSAENPWARAMLERIEMIDGIFLTARIGTRLVACGLVLQDNGTQINATLGLVAEVPYVYFMLVYESMKIAFEHKARFIRLGSGTYDVKQQLGFSQEDNNTLSYCASNRALQVTSRWLEKLA